MIKGKKVDLRTIRERDLDLLFELESDLENKGDFYPINFPSAAGFKRRFQEDGFWSEDVGTLLIVNKEDDILGKITYFKPVRYFDALEIAYILFRQGERGQGHMTETLSLLINYLFWTKQVGRLQLTAVVGNQGSKRVAEKCGFKSEGILRHAVFVRGKSADLEMFSLLREELKDV